MGDDGGEWVAGLGGGGGGSDSEEEEGAGVGCHQGEKREGAGGSFYQRSGGGM